jgi:monoamine oxidase
MIDAISTYVNGAELDQVSILDMDAYEDTEINWRVRRGYGALMAAYGASCPLALNTEVTLIDHSGTRLRIRARGHADSQQGDRDHADQSDRRGSDPLPIARKARRRALPLGLANKVMLALSEPDALPKDGNLRGATMRPRWAPITCARSASPASRAFSAAALPETGRRRRRCAGAQSIGEIAGFLGNDFRRKLTPLSESAGPTTPSRAAPIRTRCPARRRARAAAPVDGRLFLPEGRPRRTFSRRRMEQGTGERAAAEVVASLATR